MSRIRVSDYIVRFIADLGVKHVFVVAGGGNLPMIDSIRAYPGIEYIATHHEQAAAMAAEAYSRVTENLGVCCVTFGPGATNTLTGVTGAWLDSIPVLYISGQVKKAHMATNGLRQLGVQEVNIVDMVRPITKWAEVVTEPLAIKHSLLRAFTKATLGRPGPVFLDIPMDVQSATIEEDDLIGAGGYDEFVPWSYASKMASSLGRDIRTYKRPILFAGHGIALAKARTDFRDLVEALQIPVVTAMLGHDLLPSDHPLYVGRPGVFGDRAGNLAIQNADLIISIGVRHSLWNMGYDTKAFGKHATKIVVDIDQAELDKETYKADTKIRADAGHFIRALVQEVASPLDISDWRTECRRWKEAYPVNLPEYAARPDYVNSYHFTDTLSRHLSDDEIIFTGVGTAFTGTLQSIKLRANQRFHCNVGCASMGYDLPAAIGASFAANKKRIILLTGDGGIMMNIQELQTISRHRLPIKIFLFNNRGYLAIKNTQNAFYGGNLAAVDEDTGLSMPDFKDIANAFGISYLRLENHQDMDAYIDEALNYIRGPVIVDLNMDPNQPLIPKVALDKNSDGSFTSRGLEDMYPLLPREEFEHNIRHVLDKVGKTS